MAEVPKLLKVPDVLERLQGTIGRNKLEGSKNPLVLGLSV